MLFSSIPFLFYFLPLVLILYFIMPAKGKNFVLLLFSLIFYAWGEPRYIFLMILSILCAYFFALGIEKAEKATARKIWMILSIAVSLSFLLYFKYIDFFIQNINALTGLDLAEKKLALPIGISFYTFQIVSYTIDVYRKETKAQKNLISFGAYVSLFPQLIAGPIVRYTDIERELNHRTHSVSQAAYGAERFVLGLGKKVLIANLCGEFVEIFRSSSEPSVLFYWLFAIAVLLQIYFDFSGYSDMAIGLGSIFGFHFPENFKHPLISKSAGEFWRRWHISLGSWFRDYVYIPLGGNRVGTAKYIRNVLAVWFLTGFWHGASWNFILWGLLFAFLLTVEKYFLNGVLKKCPAAVSHIYMIFVMCFSFVLFHDTDLSQVLVDYRSMLGLSGLPFLTARTWYYLRSYGIIFLAGIVGATPIPVNIYKKISENKTGKAVLDVISPILLLGILILSVGFLVDGSFNPFLYFRF